MNRSILVVKNCFCVLQSQQPCGLSAFAINVAQANKQYSNHHFSLILRHFSRSAGYLHFLSLSFVNRSFLVVQTCNVGKICRIMPRFYATMQALCCVVPWQMNNTFIGIFFLQNLIKMFEFAPVCQPTQKVPHFTEIRLKWQDGAKCGISWP